MEKDGREHYREALSEALLGLNPKGRISINEIGKNHLKFSLSSILSYFMQGYCKEPLGAVNYLAHYGSSIRLEDVITVGFPEYALDELSKMCYLDLRKKQIFIPTNEELLKKAMDEMNKKYSERRVKKLRERLGIID